MTNQLFPLFTFLSLFLFLVAFVLVTFLFLIVFVLATHAAARRLCDRLSYRILDRHFLFVCGQARGVYFRVD